VDGPAEEQLDIDPRLLEGFALFREAGPGPDGPLDMDESKRVDQLRAMVLSGRIPPLTARGLVFDQVRKVALSPSRTMLAIPGKAGLHVVVRDSDDGVSHGSGSKIAGRIQGRPMMSIGPSLIGFAVDGVEHQAVEFRDGTIGQAEVRHNTYCIDDPSWAPHGSTAPVRRSARS
jgi:hypothetical protein